MTESNEPNLAAGAVLACTDLSPAAERAVWRAAQLAQQLGLPVGLLHVLPAEGMALLRQWLGVEVDVEPRLMADANHRLLQQWQSATVACQPAPPMVPMVRRGALIGGLKAAIVAHQPAVVVLGARGEGDLVHQVLGTTALRLLQRSQRPMLVVRGQQAAGYQRVLLPVDFSAWSALTLQCVRRFMPQAHVVLLHAWSVPFEQKMFVAGVEEEVVAHYRAKAMEEAELLMAQFVRDHGAQGEAFTVKVVQGDASHVIVAQAQALQCDVIALGKHGQQAAEDWLLGSVCKHVLNEFDGDVLGVNGPNGVA